VQLEWSHLVNTSIIYSGRNDKVIADAAQILTVDDLGIAGLTPSNSPRVLSNPVVNRPSGSCIGAPSNNEKIMVELNVTFRASIRLIDTIFVIHKVRCHIESGHSRAIIEY
jgi:hypothetical protein